MAKGLDIMNGIAQAMSKGPKEKVAHKEMMEDSHEMTPAEASEKEPMDLDNDQGDESGHQDPELEALEQQLSDLHASIKALASRRS